MLDLKLHTVDSAPEDSRPALAAAQKAYGFVPNLMANLANAPAAAKAYMAIASAFEETSLTPGERQVVLLATSFANRCHYCMAAHSTLGVKVGLSVEDVLALREGNPIPDRRLEVLRRFTDSVVRNRGWIPEAELSAFLDGGFGEAQVLEVLTGVTLKTLSNYMNHMALTPVDARFAQAAWVHPEEGAATTA